MAPPVLDVRSLVHRFPDVEVLKGVDLCVEGHGVYGFLGVNGAGKTTLLRILNGFLIQTGGTVKVLGEDVGPEMMHVRRRIGYLPQSPAFHGWMTGEEVLRFTGDLLGLTRVETRQQTGDVLARTGLASAARRRVGGYSGGMRQRLGLAQALLGRPDLYLLDEPVSALDPVGRQEVLDLVTDLGRQATVFMSSHVLGDVERLADHVTILHEGRVIVREATRALRARFLRPIYDVVVSGDTSSFEKDLNESNGVGSWRVVETHDAPALKTLRVHVNDEGRARVALPGLVAVHGLALHRFGSTAPSLEEVFLRVIGSQGDAS